MKRNLTVALVFLCAFLTLGATTFQYANKGDGTQILVYHAVDNVYAIGETYTETNGSDWLDVHAFDTLSVQVCGATAGSATFKVYGSNDVFSAAPIESTSVVQLGSDITADGITTITAVPYYVRINCTAIGTGIVNVYAMGKP